MSSAPESVHPAELAAAQPKLDATQRWIVAVTGASGSIFAIKLLHALQADPRVQHIDLVVSPSALRVLAEETSTAVEPNGRTALLQRLTGAASPRLTLLAHDDIGASIASGSYPTAGMIVVPCSMGTLGGIAHGLAQNLIERAADVCLKERRRLVLCVRETPLNLIHLRNMAAATEAGATIFPIIPTLYNHPQTTDEIATNFAHRVLLHLGLPQPGAYVWGSAGAASDND